MYIWCIFIHIQDTIYIHRVLCIICIIYNYIYNTNNTRKSHYINHVYIYTLYRLTDNKGNVVNFRNTIVIFTSNIGKHNYDDLLYIFMRR